MKLTTIERHEQILKTLEQADGHTTGNALARLCDVSSKTIRGDIQLLNELFSKEEAEITAASGKGYALQIYHHDTYERAKQTYLHAHYEQPNGTIDRSRFIMRTLLLSETYERIEDLSEKLFIERTSISRDMKYVREFLHNYELSFEQKPGYGLRVSGDELHKRICMNEIFTLEIMQGIYPLPKEIFSQVSEVLDQDGISMSDHSFQNLCIYLHIMLERIAKHHFLEMPSKVVQQLEREYEYQVAKDIIQVLDRVVKYAYPREEICFLAVHLIGKRMNFISDVESCLVDILPEAVDEQVDALFQMIQEIYGFDFSDDYYLRKALGVHIISMENRVRFNTYLKNPLLYEIRQKYVLAYEISVDIWLYLHPDVTFLFSEDEIAYFAIHIQYALERSFHKNTKKRVLLINDLNSSSTELLSYELLSHFDADMEICDNIYSRRLNEYDISAYDVILSTVPLPPISYPPILTIAPILNAASLAKLSAFFTSHHQVSLGTYLQEQDIDTCSLEDSEAVFHFLETKWKAKKQPINIHEMKKREHIGGTALQNLLALPHLFLEEIQVPQLMVMVLDKPIVWNVAMVQVIFLCAIPLHHVCDCLDFYDVLSRFLQDEKAVDKMMSLHTKRELKTFFDAYK